MTPLVTLAFIDVRVILLGHNGFVGSAIRAQFQSCGAEVIPIDRKNYATMCGTSCDLLINANGNSDRRLAAADPLASFRANVDTALASIKDFPAPAYLLISSIDVYNDLAETTRNGEDASIDPLSLSPYGFMKRLTEMVVQAQAKRWVILRLGGLVGPGLWKNSIFDLLERRTLFIHPASSRPFINTGEVAQIAWKLRGEVNEIFNVCGDGPVRATDLAEALGVDLAPELLNLPLEIVDLNIAKLRSRVPVTPSRDAVLSFAADWRAGKVRGRERQP